MTHALRAQVRCPGTILMPMARVESLGSTPPRDGNLKEVPRVLR